MGLLDRLTGKKTDPTFKQNVAYGVVAKQRGSLPEAREREMLGIANRVLDDTFVERAIESQCFRVREGGDPTKQEDYVLDKENLARRGLLSPWIRTAFQSELDAEIGKSEMRLIIYDLQANSRPEVYEGGGASQDDVIELLSSLDFECSKLGRTSKLLITRSARQEVVVTEGEKSKRKGEWP